MIKLAKSNDDVYVKMSGQEFEGLARRQAEQVADGAQVSLLWLKQLITTSQGNTALLQQTKSNAEALAASIGQILT